MSSKKEFDRQISDFVESFLSEDTDFHPGIDCTESEFNKWASMYVGNRRTAKKVWAEIRRKTKIRQKMHGFEL